MGEADVKFEIKGSSWEIATMTLAALSLVLVLVNGAMVFRNQSLQVEITQRQQVVNQGLQFGRIRQALAQVLANLSVQKSDREIGDLLTRHNISVTVPSAAAPATAGK
jgi:uncharacterized protein YpmS